MSYAHTSQEKLNEVIHLFKSTNLTYEGMAKATGTSCKIVWRCVHNNFSKEEIASRKAESYRRSKLGVSNPMFGKHGESHHNYIGEWSDGKGYILQLKPSWFTGRVGSRHVFQHQVVMCEHLGLTEIPSGWSVHHIDGNTKNNSISNLALLTSGAHRKLHLLSRKRAEAISSESRVQENPKRGAAVEADDMVRTA